MDQSKEPLLDSIGQGARRRRSRISRRPKTEGQSPISTPLSDDVGRVSSDENLGDSSYGGKMFDLNHCVSRSLQVSGSGNGSTVVQDNRVMDGAERPENKLKRIKLKVGGVTQTIQTKSSSTAGSGNGPLLKANLSSENAQQKQKLDKNSSLQGLPWQDFSKGNLSLGREDMGRTSTKNAVEKQHGDKSDAVRKSKRVPKRRVMDKDFDEEDDDDDDEIRYLEKLKTSKIAGNKEFDAESARKSQKTNSERVGKVNHNGKRVRSEDVDYEEDEELSADGETEGAVKTQKKGLLSELPMEIKREISLTSRQRALLSKDASSAAPSTSQVEFPNGLPPAPSRKQKEKLSEVELQLKKVEAAQRRKLQNEKAARESEAEAIRKILGQDSSRKKREEKTKKRQEELAQEKAVTAEMLSSNIIRTVIGPTGTTVTFPKEMGFPKIFEPKSSSYPPPREKCAGPTCTNPYKYRDSKSKLPLCSLQCYKAINEKMQGKGSML